MTESDRKNDHYSKQNGHALRGEHERVKRMLGGIMPESVAGFHGIEQQRVKRTMRRISITGKK